jgi:glycogen(starch) synthase
MMRAAMECEDGRGVAAAAGASVRSGRPLNVAIFASAFHPHFGGVEELCRQLALEYRRRGMDAIVVTNRWPRDLAASEVVDGIPVYRIPMRVPDGGLRVRVNYWLTNSFIRRQLAKVLRRHRIDLLHIQCVSSNGLYALDAKRRLGLPLITTLQGELTMDAAGLYQKSAYARGLLRAVLAESDLVTGCSRSTLRDGEEFFGREFGERGRVVFNGARVQDFAAGEPYFHKRPYILAIGRVVPQKGFDVLLRAFARAKPAGLDLIIAGDGSELAGLKESARELGVEAAVTFPGRVDRGKTVSLFLGAQFFVLPSRADEGLPVVCAEALAAGKAVIATRSGGAPEAIVDGETGLIVEKEDDGALAEAISRLASDEGFRGRLAAAAKGRAGMFSWPVIADEYIGLYGSRVPGICIRNGVT